MESINAPLKTVKSWKLRFNFRVDFWDFLIDFCFFSILEQISASTSARAFPILDLASRVRRAIRSSISTSDGICKSRLEIFGYECEEHTVTTRDGYILSLQRIPNGRFKGTNIKGKSRIPVLLHHGVAMDGVTWFISPPDEGLGFLLADKGYDVWVTNNRGTAFSRRHAIFSTNSSEYWNWSWDELVDYDLPEFYSYVYKNSGSQKIHFIGHSLGSLIGMASFSKFKLSNITRSAALISPIAYLDKVTSPLARSIAETFLADTYYWLGIKEFNPYGEPVRSLLETLCVKLNINCFDMLTSFTGKNCCIRRSTTKVFWLHEPQATSTKNVVHMSQMLRKGTIRKFDYNDRAKNIKHYGKPKPPSYNLAKFPRNIPIFITYGGEDALSTSKDVKHLLKILKWRKNMIVQFHRKYAHGDFVMASNAKQLVYDPIVNFLKSNS